MSNVFNSARWITREKKVLTEISTTKDGTMALIGIVSFLIVALYVGFKFSEWLEKGE